MRRYVYFLAGALFLIFAAFNAVFAHPGHQGNSAEMQNLKDLGSDQVVASLNHCNGLYVVVTASGTKQIFREFNLRFKIDTSGLGPTSGKPVLLPAGMGGDRGFVVFSSVAELRSALQSECKQ